MPLPERQEPIRITTRNLFAHRSSKHEPCARVNRKLALGAMDAGVGVAPTPLGYEPSELLELQPAAQTGPWISP